MWSCKTINIPNTSRGRILQTCLHMQKGKQDAGGGICSLDASWPSMLTLKFEFDVCVVCCSTHLCVGVWGFRTKVEYGLRSAPPPPLLPPPLHPHPPSEVSPVAESNPSYSRALPPNNRIIKSTNQDASYEIPWIYRKGFAQCYSLYLHYLSIPLQTISYANAFYETLCT